MSKHILQEDEETWFDLLVTSKVLDIPIGRTKIFKLLRDKGYLMDGNIPFQSHCDSGYFKMVLRPRYDAKGQIVQYYAVTLASTKGIELIKKLVSKQNQEVMSETN